MAWVYLLLSYVKPVSNELESGQSDSVFKITCSPPIGCMGHANQTTLNMLPSGCILICWLPHNGVIRKQVTSVSCLPSPHIIHLLTAKFPHI